MSCVSLQVIPLLSPQRTALRSWHRSLRHAHEKFACRHLRQEAASNYSALKASSKITPVSSHAREQQDRMYSVSLHKTRGTAGNQQKWTAEMAQENADVIRIRSGGAGQVSLILKLAFLPVH